MTVIPPGAPGAPTGTALTRESRPGRPGDKVIDLRDRHSGMDTFYALVASTDDGIMVIDERGVVRFANRAAEELLAQGAESLIGRTFGVPIGIGAVEIELFNSPESVERRRRVAELRVVETDWRGESCSLLSLRDVTERKRTEEALRRSEEQFRSLATSSPLGIFSCTPDGELTYANPRLVEIIGDKARTAGDLVDDAERSRVEALVHAAKRGTTTNAIDCRGTHVDGSRRWLRIRVAPTFDGAGNVRAAVGTVADNTAHIDAVHSNERLSSIIEATTDLVAITNPDGEFLYLNRAARSFLGIFEGESFLEGRTLQDLYPAWAKSRHRNTVLPAVMSDGIWTGEMAVVRADGTEIAVSQVSLAHRAPDGAVEYISTIARDMTETKELARRLEHQALHDALTGLPNRSLFIDRLGSALSRLARRQGYLGVLFLDLDRFKSVNDTLGHASGDQLIVEVAARLSAVLRPGDTVARFAGDEFVVLCEELSSKREGERIASRIVDVMTKPFDLSGTELFLTASVGLSMTNDSAVTPDSLLRSSDAAMYHAKDNGKNRYEVFDEQMRANVEERARLEYSLHRAFERGEFFCEYQPEYSLTTGKLVGFEVLARWNHPERGRLGPDEFIPLAEETGMIVEVGEWILRDACINADRLQSLRSSSEDDSLLVAVNLSGRQLAHPELVRTVHSVVQDTGVDPSLIGIEVTESVLMHDLESTIRKLSALKSLGLTLGIDDFGTGYSSLAHLRAFPVEFLKIDRTFVRDLGKAGSDSTIAAVIVGLAQSLGLRSIGEGIETEVQKKELTRLGCDIGQGWLLGSPRTADALLSATTPDATD